MVGDRTLSRAFTIVLVTTAAAKIVLACLGVVASLRVPPSVPLAIPAWLSLIQMGVFSAAGALLIYGAGTNSRPVDLGTVFLLVASSFALRPLTMLANAVPQLFLARVPLAVSVDAYLPYFLWRFFSDFPRGVARRSVRRVERWAVYVSGTLGTLLFLANAILVLPHVPPAVPTLLAARVPNSQYWSIVYGLSLPVVPFALWKTSTAQIEERRRLLLFLTGLLAAAVPVSLYILLYSLWPAFASTMDTPRVHARVMPLIQVLILTVPITTTYAVLVEHVLDFRLLLQLALQYAVARTLVTGVAAGPFMWVAWDLYRLRHRTLSALLSGASVLPLALAAAFGVVMIRLRRRVGETIDRTFFREGYDAHQILVGLVQRSRAASTTTELADLLMGEIDRALHLESMAVLFADPSHGELRPPRGGVRPLSTASKLALLLAAAGEPLSIDLEKAVPEVRDLPQADREWLAEAGARLLLPLLSSHDAVIGVIVLGMKRSELPYTRDDRQLLSLIAASGAATLETRILARAPDLPLAKQPALPWHDTLGMECRTCHAVHSAASTSCGHCRGELEPALLPFVVLGKFQLERQIGRGGMGVVYRAVDLALHRIVALKTLPKTSPEDSVRLRREARAMAAVVHPNLAVLYGIETWRSTPVLIVEYLEGGTLADRLQRGPMRAVEVLHLGCVLADALERLHAAGILHRDVKPSNIGYTAATVPKLLDFGVARIVAERAVHTHAAPAPSSPSQTGTEGLIGTPLYMSPEALCNEPCDASFDLWSLAVLLLEATSGQHPFRRSTWAQTLDAIRHAQLPHFPANDCSAPLWAFFSEVLHVDRDRRPATAGEFKKRLEQLAEDPGLQAA